ncbi:hypothetical protein [Micromonospora sp. NBRC 107095]|uniref:hypothetical protein n=1 Tax=Micromonospora sp. NBRC 107095 TaxID=3032209 RepID=UPI0024A56343|nr:hypothetical protein [Micromonospora sp. NBRC 107095]GLZ62860.1 hypothetical protein Misp05_64360 [Micromonospora sp. NBRC 107095]
MEATVRTTEYTVCALPEDHFDAGMFSITVADRGSGKWAVLRGKLCLGADGTWDFEPIPSDRTDEWKAAHRFDEATAIRLAREAAPKLRINGWTPESILAHDRRVQTQTP